MSDSVTLGQARARVFRAESDCFVGLHAYLHGEARYNTFERLLCEARDANFALRMMEAAFAQKLRLVASDAIPSDHNLPTAQDELPL